MLILNKTLIYIFIFYSFFCMTASALGEEKASNAFTYRFILTGSMITLDEEQHAIFYGDLGINANFCNSKSLYYCVDEEAFHFAVPKDFTLSKTSWSLNGHFY